jgi:hypothetical protein
VDWREVADRDVERSVDEGGESGVVAPRGSKRGEQLARLTRLLEAQTKAAQAATGQGAAVAQGAAEAAASATEAAVSAAEAAEAAAARVAVAEAAAAAAQRSARQDAARYDAALEKMHEMLTAIMEQMTTALEAMERRVSSLETKMGAAEKNVATLISNPYFLPDNMSSPGVNHSGSGQPQSPGMHVESLGGPTPSAGGRAQGRSNSAAAAAAAAARNKGRANRGALPERGDLDSLESIEQLAAYDAPEGTSMTNQGASERSDPEDSVLATVGDNTEILYTRTQTPGPSPRPAFQPPAPAPPRSGSPIDSFHPEPSISPDAARAPAAFGSLSGEAQSTLPAVPTRTPEFLKPAHAVREERSRTQSSPASADMNARVADLLESRNELNTLRFVQRTIPVWDALSADNAQRLLQVMCKCALAFVPRQSSVCDFVA